MELSFDHRFIFVHVHRTGGQSVSEALKPFAHIPGPRTLDRFPLLRRRPLRGVRALREHNFGHITAKQLQAELPDEVFSSFLKFAFVRNPWDWQVSIFHYVTQREDHPDHERFQAFAGFSDYLDWRVNEAGPELQTDYVLDHAGEPLVDHVGRFETLEADFAAVCELIGIKTSLPRKNGSSHRDFRDYYTPGTRALVGEAYRRDVEYFGYRFEAADARPTGRGAPG